MVSCNCRAWFVKNFRKRFSAQWEISKALLLNLIVQVLALAYTHFVQKLFNVRLFLEQNRSRLYLCFAMSLGMWAALLISRNKNSSGRATPTFFAYLCLNIYCLSHIYCQGQLAELQEPSRVLIYQTMVTCDAFAYFSHSFATNEVS